MKKKTLTKKGGSGSNVVRATVEFLALMPKVGWICCSFSPLLQEIFYPAIKNHHSKFKCRVFHKGIGEFCLYYEEFSAKGLVAYDYYFLDSNVEPLSKYSPVMLHLSPATKILNENLEMWFGKWNHFQLMNSSEFLLHECTNNN